MANNFTEEFAPEFAKGAAGSAGSIIGGALFGTLRRSFSSSCQVQLGDQNMDQSRVLLQNHLPVIDQLDERNKVSQSYKRLV